MEIRRLERNMLENVYSMMKNVFLPDELKPPELINKYVQNGICCIYGFYEDNKPVSYADVVFSDTAALIDYFAAAEQYRCTGIGGKSLFVLRHELKKTNSFLLRLKRNSRQKTAATLKQ